MQIYQRQIQAALAGAGSAGKVRLIFGARQTGKSTLLKSLRHDLPTVVFNLQDSALRRQFERAPESFTQQLRARREARLAVLVDEIQKVPALLEEVQLLYDAHPGRFEFFLTGSSARRLRAGAANLLPGRAHVYHLFPLILPERRRDQLAAEPLAMGFTETPGPDTFPGAVTEDVLVYGSLPGIVLEPPESRAHTLDAYVEIYLEEEIRREALVRNMGPFQQFLELAALASGQTINLSALSREAGVPVATLRLFYQVLEDTFIGYRIPAFGEKSRKRVLTTPKFLFFDVGVRNAAARLPLTNALLQAQAGQVFENWVGLELYHRCAYAGRHCRLSYWRTPGQAEVDYVVERPDETIPVEVKWTAHPGRADIRHLQLFLQCYPDVAKRGYLICRCSAPLQLTDQITALPWTQF